MAHPARVLGLVLVHPTSTTAGVMEQIKVCYKYLQIFPLQIFAKISATGQDHWLEAGDSGAQSNCDPVSHIPQVWQGPCTGLKETGNFHLIKKLFCNNNILPSILCDWQVSNFCSTMLNQPLRRRTSRKQWRSSRRSCTKKSTQGENFKHRSDWRFFCLPETFGALWSPSWTGRISLVFLKKISSRLEANNCFLHF